MKLEQHLEGTQFELELAKALQKFIPEHLNQTLHNSEINYKEYGNPVEKKLKQILHYFSSLYKVLNDLDYTFIFLKKDRNLILDNYPELENQKAYYNYHFENYYIRLVTLGDILGRLGTLVYQLDLELKKSSAYVFKDKVKKEGYVNISVITDRLIQKLEILKEERHKKLHTGVSDIEPLDGIVIWEDLNKIIGDDTDPLLKEYTDTQILENIEKLKNDTIEIVDLIKEFLVESTTKLNELINTNS